MKYTRQPRCFGIQGENHSLSDVVDLSVWFPPFTPYIYSRHAGIENTNVYNYRTYSKPVLSGHSKIGNTMIIMTNGSLMKVESIAECSPWIQLKKKLLELDPL